MTTPNGANRLIPEVHIQSVQSVTPFNLTCPRPIRRVSAADPVGLGIFRQCLHIVLYYTKATQHDTSWLHVGWIKESLSRALMQQPLFAGRFQEGDDGELKIVGNDSGIRLVEAQISMTMSEFLDSKEDAEAKLVFWKNIDEQNPQYSPLFYIQATSFQCGGRSVGISCSLLLADLFFKEDFLKKWANIHRNLLSDKRLPVTPFYTQQNGTALKNETSQLNSIFISDTSKKRCQAMIFSVEAEKVDTANDDALQVCVGEAESKFGVVKSFVKMSSSCDAIKVENFRKSMADLKLRGIGEAGWDDFGGNEVIFINEGNKPSCVSYWVGFISAGLVMALPSPSDHNDASKSVKVIVKLG